MTVALIKIYLSSFRPLFDKFLFTLPFETDRRLFRFFIIFPPLFVPLSMLNREHVNIYQDKKLTYRTIFGSQFFFTSSVSLYIISFISPFFPNRNRLQNSFFKLTLAHWLLITFDDKRFSSRILLHS